MSDPVSVTHPLSQSLSRRPVFREATDSVAPRDSAELNDLELTVAIELGRVRMRLADVLKINAGAILELDKLAGDPVDVWVNDRLVARGEVVVVNDKFAVRVSEILEAMVET